MDETRRRNGDQCTCDRCTGDRFHKDHFTRIMDAATPVYNAIADLVKINYELADQLLAVTKERDRLREELAAAKPVEVDAP